MSAGDPPLCPLCRYDLRESAERCPECGEQLIRSNGTPASRRPYVAWDRRGYINSAFAFGATLVRALARPTSLRVRGVSAEIPGTLVFFLLLFPVTVVAVLVASFALLLVDNWLETYAIPLDRIRLAENTLRACLFLGAVGLAWLPTLIGLDLVLRRHRDSFAALTRLLLITGVWSAAIATLAAGVMQPMLFESSSLPRETSWTWGRPYADWHSGTAHWSWPCWLAATALTLQFAFLAHSAGKDDFMGDGVARRGARRVLLAGWCVGMYLLLFDHLIHLRFFLLFGVELLGVDMYAVLKFFGLRP